MHKYLIQAIFFTLSLNTSSHLLFGMDTSQSTPNNTPISTGNPSAQEVNCEDLVKKVFNLVRLNDKDLWINFFKKNLNLNETDLGKVLNSKNKKGYTPFLLALNKKRWNSIEFLKDSFLNWKIQILPNNTNALMLAAQNINKNRGNLIKEILEYGNYLRTAKNVDNKTAYDFACENTHATETIKNFLCTDTASENLFAAIKSTHNITPSAIQRYLDDGAQLAYKKNGRTIIEYALSEKKYNKIKQLLLSLIPSMLNIPLAEGKTALGIAITYHKELGLSLKEIKTLITSENINHKDNYTWAPLHIAARYHPEAVPTLLTQEGVNVNCETHDGWTPLHYAARYQPAAVPTLLTQEGVNVNCKNNNGWTPLHLAAEHHPEAVPTLLTQEGVNVNCKTNNGWTPLHIAARYHPEAVPLLLTQEGVNVNCKNNNGWTPLHLAARYHPEAVPLLLAVPGIDINCTNNDSVTPLHLAAEFNPEKVPAFLAMKGIDVNCKNLDNKTAFDLLEAKITSIIDEKKWPILKNIIFAFSASSRTLNIPLAEGKTALGIAITYHEELGLSLKEIKTLITPENINHKDNNDWTPLHLAAQCHPEAVPLLLAVPGIEINCKTNDRWTPLHLAARYQPEAVPLLLAVPGIDVNCKNNAGKRPLDVADKEKFTLQLLISLAGNSHHRFIAEKVQTLRRKNYSQFKKTLLTLNGPALNIPLAEEKTALGIAIKYHEKLGLSLKEIKTLITPENINHKDNRGCTPLHLAVKHFPAAIPALLTQEGVNVNCENSGGCTPLYLAVEHFPAAIPVLLTQEGVNVNCENSDGCTPLYLAVKHFPAAIPVLLAVPGIDVNCKTPNGWTPLHFAAQYHTIRHRPDAAAQLLAAPGIDINCTTNYGLTAFDLAEENSSELWLLISLAGDSNQSFITKRITHLINNNKWQQLREVLIQLKDPVLNNKPLGEGKTALGIAIKYHKELNLSIDEIKTLITPENINNKSGILRWTPIYLAADEGLGDIVQELINRDCNPFESIGNWPEFMIKKKINNNTALEKLLEYRRAYKSRINNSPTAPPKKQINPSAPKKNESDSDSDGDKSTFQRCIN